MATFLGDEFANLLPPAGSDASGDDILKGFGDNDTLKGFGGDDLLRGGAGDDLLRGGAGDDTLQGGTGNDQLFAGTGNDLVIGGKGDDHLVGGKGSDQFLFDTNFGNDIVKDFSFAEGDSIILTNDLVNSVFGISVSENIEISSPFGLFLLGSALELDGNNDTNVSVDGNDVTFDFGSDSFTLQGILA